VVVDQRAQNRFYRAAPPLDQPAVTGSVFRQFLVHPVVRIRPSYFSVNLNDNS